jgi:hypothetical protein
VDFEILGEIIDPQLIAQGRGIREYARLQRKYGGKYWRKLKGITLVRSKRGTTRIAEVHWYESHGIGKKEIKIKRFLT